MNCQHESRIGDFIDGALSPADARAFETHLAECATCRPIVEDLRAITATARVLERHAPPPELWSRIESATTTRPAGGFRGLMFVQAQPWGALAAAAVLVMLAGGVSWLGWRLMALTPSPATTTATAGREPDPALVQSVETQLKLAEEHYSNAIAGLEAIAKAEDSALDAQTAEVLQANLTVIDAAIGESRAALQAAPSNALAQDSLFSALQSKVALLQETIALINEMRKGNEEGAGRVISGMNP